MRRLSLLVVAAAALTAGLIFLIWPRSAPEAEAEAEPVSAPVADKTPAPAAPQPQPAALPPAQPPAPVVTDGPEAAAARANAPAPLAGRHMDGMRESTGRLPPHDLSLYAGFRRMGVAPPPETKALIELRKAGATVAELEAYVREAFPKDPRVHLVATRWIRSGPQAAAAGR